MLNVSECDSMTIVRETWHWGWQQAGCTEVIKKIMCSVWPSGLKWVISALPVYMVLAAAQSGPAQWNEHRVGRIGEGRQSCQTCQRGTKKIVRKTKRKQSRRILRHNGTGWWILLLRMRGNIEEGLHGEGRAVERSNNIQGRMLRVHLKDQGKHVLPVFVLHRDKRV